MIKGVKLLQLAESEKQNFPVKIRELFGLNGAEKKSLNPRDFSLQEMAWDMLGSDYREPGYLTRIFRESEGGSVLPSTFSNINAFVSTVGGLVEAMVMEAYGNAAFIGDEFVTTYPSRVNGGKGIRVGNDGATTDTDYAPGDALETVGLKEEYITIPNNKRRGRVIQLNELTVIYDRTDQLQSACENAGFATRREREIEIAKTVMGLAGGMTYEYNGVAPATTYGTAVGTPAYTNTLTTNRLQDYTDVQEAIDIILQNTDPATGYELPFSLADCKILVQPAKLMTARAIVRAVELRTNTASAVYTTLAPNPLEVNVPILASQVWKNLDSDTNNYHWWLINRKSFGYRQVIPFTINSAPLSSEDVRRGIANVWVAQEVGTCFVNEPRLSFYSTGNT